MIPHDIHLEIGSLLFEGGGSRHGFQRPHGRGSLSGQMLRRADDVLCRNGYPMGEFTRLRLGPVGMKDELEYFSEVGLLDTIVVTMSVTGMSTDGSRWRLRQEVFRPDGKACARLTSSGGWMDLAARKLGRLRPPCWPCSRRTSRWTTSSNCRQARSRRYGKQPNNHWLCRFKRPTQPNRMKTHRAS
jgi:acyl-CoA thioesterase FadM